MAELLRMEGITKQFGAVYANKDINLSIEEGEIHTLLGENGAGKSTLMNILIGLYQPTSGTIWLKGKKVKIDSPKTAVKLGIGMVHQHFMLVDAMTVFENIILGTKKDSSIFIKKERTEKGSTGTGTGKRISDSRERRIGLTNRRIQRRCTAFEGK